MKNTQGYIKKFTFLKLLSHKYNGLGVVTSVKHNAPTGKYDPDGTPKMKVISLIYLTPNGNPDSVNPSTRRGDIHIGTWAKGYGWEFPCDWDLGKRLRK